MVSSRPNHTKLPMARFTACAAAASTLAIVAVAAACTAVSLVFAPAQAQEGDRPFGLIDRLFGGSERVGSDRGAPVAAGDRTAQMSGSDLVLRLDRLEAQIRQLTGNIEQLQHRNQQLEGFLRRMQEDNEHRELGSKPRPSVQARPQALPPPGPAATTTPGRRGDAFDPTQNPSAPGAPQALGSIPGAQAAAGGYDDQPIGTPGGRAAGVPLRNPNAAGTAVATLPPSPTPRDEYDLAYGYILRKDYALAEAGFQNFLGKHPNDRLAGDATFWLAESLFQRQRFRDAAEAFLNVSTKFESNARAPDALLRLGQSLAALGEKEAACASLGEALRKFPRASASVKQGVEREQKRVRC